MENYAKEYDSNVVMREIIGLQLIANSTVVDHLIPICVDHLILKRDLIVIDCFFIYKWILKIDRLSICIG